jgi:hypothetical protein
VGGGDDGPDAQRDGAGGDERGGRSEREGRAPADADGVRAPAGVPGRVDGSDGSASEVDLHDRRPVAFNANQDDAGGTDRDYSPPVSSGKGHGGVAVGPVNPQNWKDDDPDAAYALDRQAGSPSQGHSTNLVTHTLTGEGFDASEDGTGRGTPLTTAGTVRSHVRPGSNTSTEVVAEPDPDALLLARLERDGELAAVPYDPLPDGSRYAAMGDAVTVPVLHWIGARLLSALERA